MKRRLLLASLLFLLLGAALFIVGVPRLPLVYYRGPAAIEAYLRQRTPLGSSLPEVRAFLNSRAHRPGEYFSADIKAGSEYPLSSVSGSGFIHACVGEYRVFLYCSVEAFYIFGPKHTLVDIRVRKTIDSL